MSALQHQDLEATPLLDAAKARTLGEHRLVFRQPVSGKRADLGLLHEVIASGLRGRGGGNFPTGEKMQAVLKAKGSKILVVNASEGEPKSSKDAFLLHNAPHLVIDGALHAASTIGAKEIHVAIKPTNTGLASLRQAIAERLRANERHVPFKFTALPSTYVAGEASALVSAINGGASKPTMRPPRMSERGGHNQPTLVDNVETLAHVALIANFGAERFRWQGSKDRPGTQLLTVSGDVGAAGVYEFPTDVSIDAVLTMARANRDAEGVLIGGYFGKWYSPDQAFAPLVQPESWGAGVVVVQPKTCPVRSVSSVMAWMASQSAGQCGPCVFGLGAVAELLSSLASGRGHEADRQRLQRWTGQIKGRGACSLPDGALVFLSSATSVFAKEFDAHYSGCCSFEATRPLSVLK